MDIATTLLEYGAVTNSESKAGFTPLHLSAQEGHTDMSTLLIEHSADANFPAKNGLTPLHLCAQEDRVSVAAILVFFLLYFVYTIIEVRILMRQNKGNKDA